MSDKDWRAEPRKPAGDLGELVRKTRIRKNMTQYDVASAMRQMGAEKAQASLVAKIETGRTITPMLHMIQPLAMALDLPFEVVFKAATGANLSWDKEVRLPPDVYAFSLWLAELDEDKRARVIEMAESVARNL